jgi:hypothetical protein
MRRRSFLKLATGASLAAIGDFSFLSNLNPVSAADAQLDPRRVHLDSEIEPLVRLLEETPRERILEEIAGRIHKGFSYRQVLTALLLAGVRNIQPRPVGFKFHAVLVINSAHLASLASPDSDRWLPIFWAIDAFKNSQAANIKEGNWVLGPVDEAAIPPSHKAKTAFIEAMDNWDESAADTAIVGLARTASAHEIFEILARYGARDFREIGHKEIYVANSFRLLETIGWHHAEPVLRSLAYALLDRAGAKDNPAKADLPADRPFRQNLPALAKIPQNWLDGRRDPAATADMLQVIREGSPSDASAKAIELLAKGIAPQSLFDAFFDGAGELLMRAPGILSLHATTFTNACHYSWQHCRDEDTRKLLLLQNASFLSLFRGNSKDKGIHIDTLEPLPLDQPGALDEIFTDVSKNRLQASRKVLSYLAQGGQPNPLATAARRLIFLKGRDAHDYKFSSAIFEDYAAMAPPWRDRYLAASMFYLKGAGDPDNNLANRTRSALGA